MIWCLCHSAEAHELRPAYLELHQTAPDTFDVLWKVPAAGPDRRLALYVHFPETCVNLTEPRSTFSGGAHLERWRVKAPNGLSGERITIDGLVSTMTDVLVRIERIDGTTQVARLMPASPSFTVVASPDHWEVVRTYAALGVEHILTGADHLLFVLALIIITIGVGGCAIQDSRYGMRDTRYAKLDEKHASRISHLASRFSDLIPLIKTVTAFTVAHSITLTAATLGFVHVPQKPVEAVIALSIVFVAAEILKGWQGREGITSRAPWVVALTFGLLHGFGFAGALSEVGLPQAHIPLALLFFNLGVEAGQLLFIGAVLGLLAIGQVAIARSQSRRGAGSKSTTLRLFDLWTFRLFDSWTLRLFDPSTVRVISAYAIGTVAMFWVIQRLGAF